MVFIGCEKRPDSPAPENAQFTHSKSRGSFLSTEYRGFEGIERISNFTGVVKSITVNFPTDIVLVVKKTMRYDDSTVLIIETNMAAHNLNLLTNLVVGKTYNFPECVSNK
jgi:hypothetical protein